MATRTTKAVATEIDYPDSDGTPMAETDAHIELVIDLRDRLKARYAADPDVYVAANLFVYYVEGQPKVLLAPDGFVAFGVPNRLRRSYKVWDEGRFPDVVFEFTSARTQDRDLGDKFDVYQDIWRVKEYFLFDPFDEYLDPPLLGYRMAGSELRPIKPGKDTTLTSKVLGLTLIRDGTHLRLRDTASGAELLTEAERRAAAEVEIARLKAELAALRRKPPAK